MSKRICIFWRVFTSALLKGGYFCEHAVSHHQSTRTGPSGCTVIPHTVLWGKAQAAYGSAYRRWCLLQSQHCTSLYWCSGSLPLLAQKHLSCVCNLKAQFCQKMQMAKTRNRFAVGLPVEIFIRFITETKWARACCGNKSRQTLHRLKHIALLVFNQPRIYWYFGS